MTEYFRVLRYEKEVFYQRTDGRVKLASVPLCFQPSWMVPSDAIRAKLKYVWVLEHKLPVEYLSAYDRRLTSNRAFDQSVDEWAA